MEITLQLFAVALLIFTALPLIKNDFWIFRVFEYPRIQKLVIAIIWIAICLTSWNSLNDFTQILAFGILLNAIYLIYQIFPFTPFAKKQLLKAIRVNKENKISILVFNVYEHNTYTQGCVDLINRYKPDVFLLLETNKRWTKSIEILDTEYPYTVKVPLENTYGMLFYSKFELSKTEIKYLVEEDIPSVHTLLHLNSGKKIKIHALHPTPPVPNENPRSTERDKELLLVAKEVKDSDLPTVVIGDLNDVAWSYTTELFLKISGLLDPRRGRGYFNTFHAKYPFMRFPLDHAFLSTHFKLIRLKKLENQKSDHFPIFLEFQYEETAKIEQKEAVLEKTADDVELAEEKLHKE